MSPEEASIAIEHRGGENALFLMSEAQLRPDGELWWNGAEREEATATRNRVERYLAVREIRRRESVARPAAVAGRRMVASGCLGRCGPNGTLKLF
jgi:hypothetical protein